MMCGIKVGCSKMVSINKLKNKVINIDIKYYRLFFLMCIELVAIAYFWVSDDAYQGLCQVVNFVESGVFSYNVCERVNTATCILFDIIVIPIYAITRNIYIATFIVNMTTTLIALYFLFYKICKCKNHIIFSGCALICSYYFICFCSSGLENSLLFMLDSMYVYYYMKQETYTHKDLIRLGFIAALLLLTRLDMAVIFFLPTVYAFIFKREDKSIIKMIRDGLVALLPLFVWLLFSFWYYGVPFPTTYYAKLKAGIPFELYLNRGLTYLFTNFFVDMLFSIILLYVSIKAVKYGVIKHKLFIISLLARVVYLVTIGGDFMYGRMFTDIYFISICLFATLKEEMIYTKKNKKIMICFYIIFNIINMLFAGIIEIAMSCNQYYSVQYINEREHYNTETSIQAHLGLPLIHRFTYQLEIPEDLLLNTIFVEDIKEIINNVEGKGHVNTFIYGFVKMENLDIYIVDTTALGDMFLANLRVENVDEKGWRVGHNFRTPPKGYSSTVYYLENKIEDENLAIYYDVICELTRGDLFSLERIETIWKFNTGYYDYLLEN